MSLGASISLVDLERDPGLILARLRAEEPVCFVDELGMWLVTRWDDVAFMEDHPELFSAATEPSFLRRALGQNMLTADAPEATRSREAMLPSFQAGGVAGRFVANELAAMADRLIDGFAADGQAELMASYAEPLSAGSLATVLGLDAPGWEQVWEWCRGLCSDIANFANDPELTALGDQARESLGTALGQRIDELETRPDDSALAAFCAATPEGGPLTRDEIINNVRLMISGGINEPRDGIGLVVTIVLETPGLLDELTADPPLWRRCVEEVFRLHTPVGTITRQTTQTVAVGGTEIPAGSLVAGVLRSANLDEDHWSDPERFKPHRHEGAHAAFALGEHRCLGEWLGRQVVRVGASRLFERLPDLRLDDDESVTLRGFEFRGPTSLNCRWETR